MLVNAVAPAVIETPILAQVSDEHIAYMTSRIPMGRVGKPDEVAALVAFLCSSDLTFSTGAVYDISGPGHVLAGAWEALACPVRLVRRPGRTEQLDCRQRLLRSRSQENVVARPVDRLRPGLWYHRQHAVGSLRRISPRCPRRINAGQRSQASTSQSIAGSRQPRFDAQCRGHAASGNRHLASIRDHWDVVAGPVGRQSQNPLRRTGWHPREKQTPAAAS